MKRLRFAMSFLAAGLLVATPAFAGDTAAAQALYSDARSLMAAGNYTDACPKLDESEKLDQAMGTLYNLGDCYEHVGKTASAWAAFDEVAREAHAAGQSARAEDARERATALVYGLAHLTIDVAAIRNLSGLKITRDGKAIGPPEWGSAIPVDSGEHIVTAGADGKKDWTLKVNVVRHDAAVVKIPILADARVAPPPRPVYFGPAPDAETHSDGTAQRTVGVTLAGVGVLAAGSGLVLGLMSKSEEQSADKDGCLANSSQCANQHAVDERSNAVVEGNVSSVLAIAGGVVAVGGIVLWATAPRTQKTMAKAWSVTPDVAIGQGGTSIGMRGTW
ncbi:MAG: hypothetical protein ACRELY_20090 [Polyangiaceae bacterium]